MAYLDSVTRINPSDIPAIDLYMDQVTTFMDTHLSASKRFGEDKILTKTMINNYAKNNLLPPPEKKKYSKNHILLLIFIYYFKMYYLSTILSSFFLPSAKIILRTVLILNWQSCTRRFFHWSVSSAKD